MRWFVALGLVVGCRVADLDLTGKSCPCPSGWLCDPVASTCVPSTDLDAGLTTPNLLFWFKLDETSGTVAHDSSGHEADGAVHGGAHAAWLPTGGRQNGALHFDGAPNQTNVAFPADCSQSPLLSQSFTVATWVNFDRFQLSPYTLGDFAMAHGTSGGTQGGWGLGATQKCGGETAGIEVASSAGMGANRTIRCGTTTLAPATWYHLAGVYDGPSATLDVYVNGLKEAGNLTGSATIPGTIYPPPSCVFLGATGNQNNLLQGALDEARVYDRALSSDEIKALYVASGG